MTSLRIIFAGSGAFGLPTRRAIQDAGHGIVRIFSQPDRPAGRGRRLNPTPVAQFAQEAQLPLIRTANLNAESLPEADVLVVIAFGQKIADAVVAYPRLGSINLHASRLPRFRGAAPINHAILAGETVTGNSVIRLAQRMDGGAVLAQSSLPIGPIETAGELHDRLALDGVPLVLGVLEALADGTAVEQPQIEALATVAPKLSRQSAQLDFTLSADRVARTIRALSPWPGCRVQLLDDANTVRGHLTLLSARPADGTGPCGTIVADGRIAAGEGAVQILRLQPEGGRPMTLDDYRNGHPWQPGLTVRSIA